MGDTVGVEPIVVYLDFQAIQPLSTEDLVRVGGLLRPEDEEACVWSGDAPNLLKTCVDVEGADLSLAARAAIHELDSVLLRAGVMGEVRRVVACSEDAQLVVEGADLQVLDRRCGQTYCDWCMGLLTPESIAASEQLGLDSEFAWACGTCLAKSDYRQPPDGWEPPESEWRYRDS